MYYKPVEDIFPSTASGAQDRRAAAERESGERAALRQSRIERQSSPELSALERIDHWERFHGLRLPADPMHRLLSVVATDTALPIEDIRAEQARRKGGMVTP